MNITMNGEARDVPAGLTVAGLLVHLSLPAERVAVERNREVLPRTQWDSTSVQPGDHFEVVHFVGGG
jgi:thiamine biosynthesis protein ThiS